MADEQNETPNALMTAANAEVLLPPDRATALVSRHEVVNLLVVNYVDKVQAQIDALEATKEQKRVAAAEAWRAAYEAWFAQIESRVLPRLNPWRDAVMNALGNPKMTGLRSEVALPHPERCSYDFGGPRSPSERGGGSSHRDEPRILDVLQAWVTRNAITLTGTMPLSGYSSNHTVSLAKFPMTWVFSLENAHYAPDWHSLVIDVDVRPTDEALRLIEVGMKLHDEYQQMFREIGRLQAEINTKNISTLERRALAKLTLQALGEAVPLPALG